MLLLCYFVLNVLISPLIVTENMTIVVMGLLPQNCKHSEKGTIGTVNKHFHTDCTFYHSKSLIVFCSMEKEAQIEKYKNFTR